LPAAGKPGDARATFAAVPDLGVVEAGQVRARLTAAQHPTA
jgi:hypothetical protein